MLSLISWIRKIEAPAIISPLMTTAVWPGRRTASRSAIRPTSGRRQTISPRAA